MYDVADVAFELSREIQIQQGPELRLQVCDDGAGLPDGWRAGVCITAMRERAAELGGELAIGPAARAAPASPPACR